MRAAILIALVALVGCSEPHDCPHTFANGQVVRDRLTGERFVVTRGEPFTNINTGRCSLIVETATGRKPISSYRVEAEEPHE